MSTSINSYLSSVGTTDEVLKDYTHATRLYLGQQYLKTPKVGFLYYVLFNINPKTIIDDTWKNKNMDQDIGFLVKKIELPKFTITNETLNQYNRKTVVSTKLAYNPVSIEFHDDNSDITNNLWINYYKFYYKDSLYGGSLTSSPIRNQEVPQYKNTKLKDENYFYGRYNYNLNNTDVLESFFTSVDIYVLHNNQFTQITLVNPKISEWTHDTLDQSQSAKILQNKMSINYENVFYNQGIINASNPSGFLDLYYDKTPSPNTIAGNPRQQPNYGPRGESGFDAAQKILNNPAKSPKKKNFLLEIGKQLLLNRIQKKGLGKLGPVGYKIATGVLDQVSTSNPGKYSSPPSNQDQPGVIKTPGGLGINLFNILDKNASGKTVINPAAIILPPKK